MVRTAVTSLPFRMLVVRAEKCELRSARYAVRIERMRRIVVGVLWGIAKRRETFVQVRLGEVR